jgi:zinc protease
MHGAVVPAMLRRKSFVGFFIKGSSRGCCGALGACVVKLHALRRFWSLIGLLGLLAFGVRASARSLEFPVTEIALTNGMQILILEDHVAPLVAVQVWYHVGSADEPTGRHGFAHLFEHLMFHGTDKLGPTDHFDLLHSVGGDCNAYTSFDETCYHETLPARHLELALWLESERMAFLTIDAPGFTTERKVVEEERRLVLGLPYAEIADKGPPLFFGRHPYGHDPLGTFHDLRQATLEDVHAWWSTHYVPNNATLVIVGDVQTDRVRQLCEQYFGWMPRLPQPARNIPLVSAWEVPQQTTLDLANAPVPAVGLVWRTVPEGHPDKLVLDLISTILGGDPVAAIQGGANASRLYQKLVQEERAAIMAGSLHACVSAAGGFGAGAALSPFSNDSASTLSLIRDEITRACRDGFTGEELERARQQLSQEFMREAQTVEGKATLIGRAAVLGSGVGELKGRLARLHDLTTNDLRRVARRYLDPNRAMAVTVPGASLWTQLTQLFSNNRKTEESAMSAPLPDAVLRGRPGVERPVDLPALPPLREPDPRTQQPAVVDTSLTNGLRVLVASCPEKPMVHAILALPFGSWAEAKPGAAAMTMRVLIKRTARHDERSLAQELDRHGIVLSAGATRDDCRVEIDCSADEAGPAFALLDEVVESPGFTESAFNIAMSQARTELQVSDTAPFAVADRQFQRHLFENHPYGRRSSGELEDLAALNLADLVLFWGTAALPSKATLAIAGGISAKEANAFAEKFLSRWNGLTLGGAGTSGQSPAGKSRTPASLAESIAEPPPAKPPGASRILLLDWPGASQSQICIGGLGLRNRDPRKPIANLVGSYFGGTFGSRLMKRIRVEKGATYGVSGGFDGNRFAGTFEVRTFTVTKSTAEIVRIILAEIKGLVDRPPGPEELLLHKRFFLGSAAARFETPEQIAAHFTHLALNGLPLDYLERSLGKIADASAEDCQSLARAVVDPSQLLIVVVGDASQVRAELETIAPATAIDIKGQQVAPR